MQWNRYPSDHLILSFAILEERADKTLWLSIFTFVR